MIKSINIQETDTSTIYKYLSSSVTPRPIALVSTIDSQGNKNLAPFSFFNVFSVNPPILVFSPVRRVRDNTTKHTLQNIKETKECTIALVTKSIDQQVSLASCDFPEGTNEFEKAGFTEIASTNVAPSRVGESPINFECKIQDIIELGSEGGSGALILAKISTIHINRSILDENENIDPFKLDIVSRLGGSWYGKTHIDSLYKIPKPVSKIGMGIDNLPDIIKSSNVLTGNELAILASYDSIPNIDAKQIYPEFNSAEEQHLQAKKLINKNLVEEAWQILLMK